MKDNEYKIMLIEPPYYRLFKDTYSLALYPLSLGYLAGTIRKETDWSVMAYNAEFNPPGEAIKIRHLTGDGHHHYINNLRDPSGTVWRDIQSIIRDYDPTVVGISAKSQNFASASIVAKLVKSINREITVIIGGPHPSMVGAEVLNCPDVDIGVRCEGEKTIVELLNAIKDDRSFEGIRGIFYRTDGQVVDNGPRDYIEDLDSLCFPHEAAPEVLKDHDRYPLTAFMNIFTTRGCPYNCLFCGSRKIWSRKPRFRSPENVVREIKGLQKLGLKLIRFDDDTFGINKTHLTNLCHALIEHCPGLMWSCELHANLVDERTIALMKKAGCYNIQLGIESGNNEILKAIRKNITIEEALSACEIIKKHGIELQAFFIVGFPQETEETLRDTFEAMKKTKCDLLAYSIFTPYPGTETFDLCKEKGLIGPDFNLALYGHQSPANHFSIHIDAVRFRQLVDEIEKMADRKNALSRIRSVFSSSTIRKIQMYGIEQSLRKSIKLLMGK